MNYLFAFLYFITCFFIGSIIAASIKGMKISISNLKLIAFIPFLLIKFNYSILKDLNRLYIKKHKQSIPLFKKIKIYFKLMSIFNLFLYDLIFTIVIELDKKVIKKKRTRVNRVIEKAYPKYRIRVMKEPIFALV